MSSASNEQTVETSEGHDGLRSRSFLGLLVTQFLGALNDNIFRWLIVPIGKDLVGPKHAALALSAGLACFVLPYVLLAAPAGYLADRFSKRTVIVGCKVAELLIMILGIATILTSNIYLMFVAVALMGTQSALFGPSKLGSIPELVRPDRISAANGLIGLTTVIAIVLGTIAGNMLYGYSIWFAAAALWSVAAVGVATSLMIGRLRPASPTRPFPINFAGQTVRDLKSLGSNVPLLRAALGTAFFWSLAALAQVNVDLFAISELHVQQQYVGPLLAALALGAGVGSVLAGVWSAGKVELGIVPLGAAAIALSAMLLSAVVGPVGDVGSTAYYWACFWLFALGVGGGLFDVPVQSFLQHRSPDKSRGVILAASNFLTFTGMLLVSGLFWILSDKLGYSARTIFLLAGIATLPVFVYIVWLLPGATIRFLVWLASRTIYRVRIGGRRNLPERGGALLVVNHVSWIDGVLLLLTSSRPLRIIAYADYIKGWWVNWLAREMGAIPIGSSRKSMVGAIRTAREALEAGELVCIFPEGAITRTGQMQAFRPGFLSILKGNGAPVIPVYLDGLWGSIFSFAGGNFFWKWPRQWPYPVAILFGRPMKHPANTRQVQQAVEQLGVEAMEQRQERKPVLPRAFLRNCRRSMRREKIADSSGVELTGAGLLTRTLVLRRLLRRETLQAEERYVGILLPPSAGAVLANAAVSVDGRIAVNLNYTVSSDVMNHCIARCGIRHVLTSRKVMKRLDLQIDAELVYLEDFKDKVTTADKLLSALSAWLEPVWSLERRLGLTRLKQDDLMTVIFTSGSTGEPKGAMLTYANIGSNVDAVDGIIRLSKDDVLIGILPLFHSFGYTTTLWTALALEPKAVYHYNPLEPKAVGKICREHGGTILVATPTFTRSYMRRCPTEDLETLDVVFCGAEKLPVDLAEAFERKFGVRPTEGYGTTELSPVVAANVPPSRAVGAAGLGIKEGTVGRPIPGVAAKVVDRDTNEDLDTGQSGMLLISGPNVMKGYMGQPELTAEVIRDGWYVTGDIAEIDEDGFIRITGRESRFSKIGGEMVPHIRVEEAIGKILASDEDSLQAVVSSVPHARKGERLVVIHTGLPKPSDDICRELGQAGLPPIWIPSPDSFRQVEEIPVLGTGKLDLRQLKQLALEKFPPPDAS